MNKGLIGIFDSGVGGLTVADKVEKVLPSASFVYFGDTKYVPYGARPAEEVVALITKICRHLVDTQVEVIVMACNTSSALALGPVRSWCPVPVIGIIEAAAKAAVGISKNGNIGVIANKLTASSGAYERAAAAAFASIGGIEPHVYPMGCPKLVPLVEAGNVSGPEAYAALNEYLTPLQEKNIDTLILGCTHYPFLRPAIEKILGPSVTVVDPADYVAAELEEMGWGNDGTIGEKRYQASGDGQDFSRVASELLGKVIPVAEHIEL